MGGPGEGAIFVGILAVTFAMISLPAARFIGFEMEKSNAPLPEAAEKLGPAAN